MDAGQNFSLEADTADYIKHMKVKGSDENKFFYEYQSFMGHKQKEIEPLRTLYAKVKNNKDSAKIVADKISIIDAYNNELKSSQDISLYGQLSLDLGNFPKGKYKLIYYHNFDEFRKPLIVY